MKARDLMTPEPAQVTPSDSLQRVSQLMAEHDCGCIPVVTAADQRSLVGVVTDRDITIRAVAAGRDAKTTKVSEIMSADPMTVEPDADVDEAARIMAEAQVRRLPVVKDGQLMGIIVTAQMARREKPADLGETIKEISEPASGRASHGRG